MAETLNYDNLVGRQEPRTFTLTLKSGENVVRGEVLSYETTTNKIRSYDAEGSNGLESFYGIAAEAKDATSGDTNIVVYVQGEFNINSLVFSDTSDSATQAFINSARALGCLLYEFQSA